METDEGRLPLSDAARVGTVVIASAIAVGATIMFLVLGFAGIAAWSDYSFRGCPEAVQCSDAEAVMWGMAWASPASLMLAVTTGWLAFRIFRAIKEPPN
jgi:hypothetical protein